MLNNDDSEILQGGSEVLRAFVYAAQQNLASFTFKVNNADIGAIQLLLKVIEKQFNPAIPDEKVLYLGNLITAMFLKVLKQVKPLMFL